jgi:RimJ/RimL family protein N-acetyltransferase
MRKNICASIEKRSLRRHKRRCHDLFDLRSVRVGYGLMIPELSTERLRMRALREDDFQALKQFWGDPETARFVGGVCNEEDAWRRLAAMVGHWSLRGYGIWALEDRQSATFLGYSGLWNPHGWPEPEISWGLLKAHQGKGYITEAALRARDYAYQDLGWTTLISCIALENLPSIRVAERLGARFERETINRGWAVGVYRHMARIENARSSPQS